MIHLPESITVWDLRADQSLLWKRVRLWWGNCKEVWVRGKPDFRGCLTYGAMQWGAIRDTDLWTSVLYSLPNLLWHWLSMSNLRAVCSRNASLKDVHTHQCQSRCGQRLFFFCRTVVVVLIFHYLVGIDMRGTQIYHLFCISSSNT